ncbi:HEAT repeat domain-containing protein [Streptomyces sp. AK02-04a]|uniref:HEAT repeat domain-containing protein n=1 Tax=Streptomyces sp. AK02-04a TaxID=3028649 RepID=UPI0029A2529C|nr:HEAT repeat domain-containing protein [Streptomyces sp. AK02-04a]MDX3760909.1 HEAT repeat domain-containing protein [Streptomyces sp. AK02-04a]
MRAPEELNEVDWAALEHAYGPAGDVPEMIRVLYAEESPETERGESVGEELINNLNHQGSLYPATVEAVPFLAHLALHVTWHREAVLEVLTRLAELGEWGVPAPESLGGRVRAAVLAELPLLMGCSTDPDPFVRQAAIRLACVGTRPADPAVLRTLADLYESDPSAPTRADALTALALLDPDPASVRAREAAAIDDRDREVRLAAALSGLDRAEPPYPAALVAVVAADGAAVPGSHRFTARPRPFPYPGAPHDRENELLTEDPEGALSVARAWIAAGDTHQWGSLLVGQVDQRWRDREAQCVAALAEALPLHQDGAERSSIVRAIAGLTPRAGDPGSHLRDLLLAEAAGDEREYAAGSPYAPGVSGREPSRGKGHGLLWVDVEGADDDRAVVPQSAAAPVTDGPEIVRPHSTGRERTIRAAQRALARAEVVECARLALAGCGDLRLLEQPGNLSGPVLATFLTHHRDQALPRLHPVLPELIARGSAELLDALGPDLAAAHLPQLKQALREHPTVAAARLLGELGPSGTDAETADLLAILAPAARHDIQAEAAVSRALITGDAEPAVETLRGLLRTPSPPGILPAVGRLGPLAAPLAPEVVALLNDPREYGRSQAADAYWRITGNPRPVLPLLLTRAAPTTTYASNDTAWYDRRDALRVLAGMRTAGALATTPPELRPLLELCATSPRRVTWKDDDELRRLALTLLDEPMPS